MAHDFNKYPELSNRQLDEMRWESPHKQFEEDFTATVVKVHDGDTIRVMSQERDFDFPIRFINIDSKELNEGGKEAGDWLRNLILNKIVTIQIDKKERVDKYGRLLGRVFANGMDVGEEEIRLGLAVPFNQRNEGKLPNINKTFNLKQWY